MKTELLLAGRFLRLLNVLEQVQMLLCHPLLKVSLDKVA